MAELEIAEISHDSGALRYRYGRYLAPDGGRWIRHGLFVAYQENGAIASEGTYEHGVEHGLWKDFHPNGQLAALGRYDRGIALLTPQLSFLSAICVLRTTVLTIRTFVLSVASRQACFFPNWSTSASNSSSAFSHMMVRTVSGMPGCTIRYALFCGRPVSGAMQS